jgi:hypothetical protein
MPDFIGSLFPISHDPIPYDAWQLSPRREDTLSLSTSRGIDGVIDLNTMAVTGKTVLSQLLFSIE